MKYTSQELAEMANKLRAGETIEIDGVRIKAKVHRDPYVLACAVCEVRCDLVGDLSTICALTDLNNPKARKPHTHYLEYAERK